MNMSVVSDPAVDQDQPVELERPPRLLKPLAHGRCQKIWIDLDNSPHVPFFVPIIRELEGRGIEVVLTARNAFQVPELVELHHLRAKCVGRHHGKHAVWKIVGLLSRALQLLPFAVREKPDLAVAHCSRAQLVASRILRIPTLWISDYEFAKGLPFFSVDWQIIPEVIPAESIHLEKERILKYPGIKEDVYVPEFKPDPSIKPQLSLNADDLVVTVRPPADEAHYHSPLSDELFRAAMDHLSQQPKVKIVMLPRSDRQAERIRQEWSALFEAGKVLIPPHAVDGLNLIWHSDLVVSGGGTMNREAAALGVPVYSIFGGAVGSVDRHLEKSGRLLLLKTPQDVRNKIRLVRRNPESVNTAERAALRSIVTSIVTVLESLAGMRP